MIALPKFWLLKGISLWVISPVSLCVARIIH